MNRRRSRLLLLGPGFGLLALALWPGACSIYDESLVSNGGAGGTDPADGSGGGSCEHTKPPSPPPEQPPGPDGDVDLTFSLSLFDFGEPFVSAAIDGGERPAQDYGYDLDNTCTGPASRGLGEGDSCRPRDWAVPKTEDFAGGRDNGLSRLIESIADSIEGFGTPSYNEAIRDGRVSILLEVKGYNQTAYDDRVELTVYTAAPINALDPNHPEPQFNGTDEWPITSSSFLTDDQGNPTEPLTPRFVDSNAYVSNGTLVARLDATDLRLSIAVSPQVPIVELIFELVQTFYTADIVYDESQNMWTLKNGTIAARWPVQNLFDQLDQFPDPDTAPNFRPLCTNSFSYPTFRRKICAAVDILSTLGGPSQLCDAISMGIRFEAVEAIRGQIFVLNPLLPRCDPAVSPSREVCDEPDGAGSEPDSGGSELEPDDAGADSESDSSL